MEFQIEDVFSAVGCACRPNTLAWCPATDLIIFGASTNICLIDFDQANDLFRIVDTFAAHDSEIIAIKLVKSGADLKDYSLVCSSSVQNQLKLWHLSRHSLPRLTCLKTVSNLAISSNFLTAYSADGSSGLCAYSQYDSVSFLRFNRPENTESVPLPSLHFTTPVLSLEFIPYGNFALLAIGLSNGNVEVFYSDKKLNNAFMNVISMKQTENSWVRVIASKGFVNDQFYLAFACDELIKLWHFGTSSSFENNAGEIRTRPVKFVLKSEEGSSKLLAKLDAVLAAHDGKVHSLCWNPHSEFLQLISASSDKNVIIWEFSTTENHWLPKFRLGEVGGEDVGFYDAVFSPDGSSILYHSFYGAFNFWRISEENATPFPFPVSGHFGEVTDLSWDPSGSYLISCGLDKVTRIFAPFKGSFVEIARPQIHGHDLNCLVPVTSTIFVSGGEEKIFRVFQASFSFIKNLQNISDISSDQLCGAETVGAASATLPELGLSNKAVPLEEMPSCSDVVTGDENFIFHEPPRDEQLSRFTLFPEVHKLYGHGFEVFAVAANHRGTLLATSCKASQPEHAVILLWDTTWQQRAALKAHQLTVTQLAFSPDDRFLLSVSRDRTWTLFRATATDEDPFAFSVCFSGDRRHGKHSRIIWACAWAHDSRYFATVSRDKTLNVWRIEDATLAVTHVHSFVAEDSLTAVDFAPGFVGNASYLLAVGQENGKILLLEFGSMTEQPSNLSLINQISRDLAHSKTVTKLRFRPQKYAVNFFELASGSTDHKMKVHKFRIS